MNRRSFCTSLAMVPVAAVAVSAGVPTATRRALIYQGAQTGRWSSNLYRYQNQALYVMTQERGVVRWVNQQPRTNWDALQ